MQSLSNESMLIEANATLTKQLQAKEKRIRYLEFILEQRAEITRKKWNPRNVAEMLEKVYRVFVLNPGVGFTYEEAEREFQSVWHFHSAFVGPRMRDLFREGKLWRGRDENGKGKVRYYLKLDEKKGEMEHEIF